jgi:murein DD-endopeptidase MepM/ murein hydrolase activator NlpD
MAFALFPKGFGLHRHRGNWKRKLLILLAVVIGVPLAAILFFRLEGEAPQVTLSPEPRALGVDQELKLQVTDRRSGLRHLQVSLLTGDRQVELARESWPISGLLGGGPIREHTVSMTVQPKALELSDGPARLQVTATDFAWRRWLQGNRTYIEHELVIDTQPPLVTVMTQAHNLNPGGSGLIVYKLSEECSRSGVMVGDQFFPGQGGATQDPLLRLCFFALSHEQRRGTVLNLIAEDAAGNQAKAGFNHYIRNKSFKTDTIRISDNFLNRKMPEFVGMMPELASLSPEEQFLKVNREMRAKSYAQLVDISKASDPQIHWRGMFLRLPNAARKAGFADSRTYFYQDREIDRQVHMGIDLASVAQSPVPAANHGRVAFVGTVGIYGNSVVIDHGFGLFSLYSHLSNTSIVEGQAVAQGDIIGRTGSTGMAGGDHLHFAMMVHHTYVNPVEWWDPHWIKDNVTDKLEGAGIVLEK